ncbi:hypothetical protein L0Z42_23705 [Burkholderia multivorans]|nr:hypothetical protein [Burkholderia multivorans]MCO1373513.1 hypothetical protein [Burkholderia multivorans]MCO1469782.1 hypothetical protein [Burkholderia multivorans]
MQQIDCSYRIPSGGVFNDFHIGRATRDGHIDAAASTAARFISTKKAR